AFLSSARTRLSSGVLDWAWRYRCLGTCRGSIRGVPLPNRSVTGAAGIEFPPVPPEWSWLMCTCRSRESPSNLNADRFLLYSPGARRISRGVRILYCLPPILVCLGIRSKSEEPVLLGESIDEVLL